ncbi:MAG: AbrB/MazE/SpoVT family DNA-binding domain-containing protein [Deinococcota bacterium]|jgi:AbrB family looped-hinge helix DNA binding protein|nr:AbrB/MazE/SpoVT family DNA-binding domain-containing protein [Deinococcota bacterium]
MHQSRISSKGQVVIPKEVRQTFGLQEGDKVAFVEEEGRIVLLLLPRRTAAEVLDALAVRRPKTDLEGDDLLQAERMSARERRAKGR